MPAKELLFGEFGVFGAEAESEAGEKASLKDAEGGRVPKKQKPTPF